MQRFHGVGAAALAARFAQRQCHGDYTIAPLHRVGRGGQSYKRLAERALKLPAFLLPLLRLPESRFTQILIVARQKGVSG